MLILDDVLHLRRLAYSRNQRSVLFPALFAIENLTLCCSAPEAFFPSLCPPTPVSSSYRLRGSEQDWIISSIIELGYQGEKSLYSCSHRKTAYQLQVNYNWILGTNLIHKLDPAYIHLILKEISFLSFEEKIFLCAID